MHHVRFRRNALALAMAGALLLPLSAMAQSTSSSNPASAQPKTLKEITVLGSLIPRAQIEGAAPVQVVTGAQIKAQGYTTLFQFIQSLPQTSGDSDFYNRPSTWGNTAVNARTVDLRGIGPQFTLLMVDGIPVVDYPMPENATFGHFDIQNAANIPLGMIDRIEILATGASAIYGSDAMAGVINIILKKQYQGDDLSLKMGGDTRGGQNYGNFTWTGGHAGNKWHIVYNFEHENRSPLWGMDRPGYDAADDAGFGSWNAADRMFGYQYDVAGAVGSYLRNGAGTYITPPPGSCESFPSFIRAQSHTVATKGDQVGAVTNNGSFCAQPAVFQDWVLEPGIRNNSFYVGGDYELTPNVDAYASAALYLTHGWSQTQLPGYGFGTPFYDAGSGQVISGFARQFTVAEIGNMAATYDNEKYWDVRAGLKGGFLDNRFNWNLQLASQKYIVHEDYTAFDTTAYQNFFLGQQLGAHTVTGADAPNVCGKGIASCEVPVYDLNQQALWFPITPGQYATFGASGEDKAYSLRDDATFNINGDLFNVPWADQSVGWGAVLEADHEEFGLNPDPALSATFQNPFGSDNEGGGTRMHYALGTEFRVPIVKTLTWDIAGRVDKYHDHSIADIARTWKTGLEWRPYRGLLLRGTYGTNFRAPGLDDIYLKDSVATVGDFADPLQCIQTHNTACNDFQHPASEYFDNLSGGNTNLLPMTGRSWTYGFVWDIPHVQGLSVQADYWRLVIDNEIEWIGLDQALTDEAGCRTGLQVSGAPYTAHPLGSAYCQEAIANVTRDAAGNITQVRTGPINEAYQSISGVDGAIHYNWTTENLGAFRFTLNYTDNLTWFSRTLASDPLINTRNQHVESRITAQLNWLRGPWNVTLYGLRWGGVEANNYNGCQVLPNGIQPQLGDSQCRIFQGNIAPWYIFSTAVSYQFDKRVRMTLNVANLFNKIGSIPFYSGGFEFVSGAQGDDYTGRQVFLTINYKLD
ncbi:MAG TPA: TonB-dependent receptor [Rhodanobacteraceae bacterium]|nr:TonB-dependent receptor [Rhodanobacteraceae bacterium]